MNTNGRMLTRGRKRIIIAASLFLATAIAGAAVRGRHPATGGTDGARRYTATPARPVSFTGILDKTAVLVGGEPLVRMELVMAADTREEKVGRHVPTDLVVILDRSGSMAGEKIEHARAAIRELVSQLGSRDRFALVTYADFAGLAIPLATAGDGARSAWLETVGAIFPNGGTNMSSGLDLALDTIESARTGERVPRVILISDGLANQGDPSHEGLVGRARRAARAEYMLSTVGVGADFNEYLMSAISDAGTGNYYYLESAHDLAGVFARELGGARTTVASGLEVRIEPGDGVEVVDAAGYPFERGAGAVVFRPGSLFAGQERRVWVTLRVPNGAVGEHALGRFSLAYGRGNDRFLASFDETPRVASVAAKEEFFAAVDRDAWSRSVVVEAYNEMQEEVAREVKAGRRDGALEALQRFRDETAPMNAAVRSPEVKQKLESLGKLEQEVAAAFEGDDQAARQNELSKARSADALDQRRAGSKR